MIDRIHAVGRLIGRSVRLIVWLVIAAWLIGRVVSDRYTWSQWLLWIPTAIVLLLAAGAGLTTLIADARASSAWRRSRRVWGAVLALLIAWFSLLEHRLLHAAGDPPMGVSLLHWNMMFVPGDDREALAGMLLDLDAEIKIVTNLGTTFRSRRLTDYIERGGAIVRTGPFAIISSRPLLELRPVVASGGIHISMVTIDTRDVHEKPLRIWMVDLPSDPRACRGQIVERALELLSSVSATPPNIMLGDFNITRGSHALARFAPGYRHAYDLAGHGYGGTFHRAVPLYHIDHMLVGREVDVGRYDLVDPGVSRHRAQRAVIVRNR